MEEAGERSAIVGPRWRFLAETSGLLDRSLDSEETLAGRAIRAAAKERPESFTLSTL